ncbi:hypothetical protein QUF63_00125 [Anaerolineales bacterium HSG25]|nr:hypothetical protein [Anaerolineales bacterium HSG25]
MGIYRLVIIAVMMILFITISPTLAQQGMTDNLLLNGDFEAGFQNEYGLGYGWGGFSNGSAVVGWNADTWDEVVLDGQYSQLIQIEDANEVDRYAGIYQTVAVVSGRDYQLTINGLIRSEEGSAEESESGYALQIAVDQTGGTTWETLDLSAWQTVSWSEQPLYQAAGDSSVYNIEGYETTITAETEQLTLFVRGWKKWNDEHAVVFNLDELSLVETEQEIVIAELEVDTENPDTTEILTADMAIDEAIDENSLQVVNQTVEQTVTEESDAVDNPETTTADTSEVDVNEVDTNSTADMLAEAESVEIEVETDAEPVAETGMMETETASATSSDDVVAETEVVEVETMTENTTQITAETESATDMSTTDTIQSTEPTTQQTEPGALPVTGDGVSNTLLYLVSMSVMLVILLIISAIIAFQYRHRWNRF